MGKISRKRKGSFRKYEERKNSTAKISKDVGLQKKWA